MWKSLKNSRGARLTGVAYLNFSKDLPELTKELTAIVSQRGLLRLDEPVRLASGAMSQDFVDIKLALCRWRSLETACQVLLAQVQAAGIQFEVAGGMTMGADPLAVGVAAITGGGWFSIRKTPKKRGTNQLIEGSPLMEGQRVLLLEDTTTTGASALKALEVVRQTGAQVVAAATVVDRGDTAQRSFAVVGVPYFAALNYDDLGIKPVLAPIDAN
ncbi:MAG: orotate phosphoribosyltransferase [Acidimicrobiia bacterium]|nr:orotate phosphoribosyltransferase [Acidimicrobiia bacterium]MYC57601.1 orotate phosphoribosyltransferase [Acidimicrobiia bacterium]MYG94891.1 orotate phosphoribosyltransferase [Acidimicrobiia bacterium]MYI31268.1 orotate phosphoribosyltransferase [Acidimicrobiia bacterium]